MKIINKPIFRFSKDTNLIKALSFCKEFSIVNNCTVLISFKEHTKPVDKSTDIEELEGLKKLIEIVKLSHKTASI